MTSGIDLGQLLALKAEMTTQVQCINIKHCWLCSKLKELEIISIHDCTYTCMQSSRMYVHVILNICVPVHSIELLSLIDRLQMDTGIHIGMCMIESCNFSSINISCNLLIIFTMLVTLNSFW